MDQKTAHKIACSIAAANIEHIEFTGGAPELNPNLKWFIEELVKNNITVTVRTNLTVLGMADYGFYLEFYRKHRVKIVASLPCYMPENVDKQRGPGVYTKSIAVLKKLNALGYGKNDLTLDLAYNPLGDFLPPEQHLLQRDYEQFLKERYDVTFNVVIPIINAPVGRFKDILRKEKKLNHYKALLRNSYNPATLDKLMCRSLLSIDYQGYLYDCDFNLALNMRLKGYEQDRFWDVDLTRFIPEITFDEHCYACTAGHGSSCHGALVKESDTHAVHNAACC
jgi:radical SAM/Cys-rich protein